MTREELQTLEAKMREATKLLNAAHSRVRAAFLQTDPEIERTEEEADAILREVVDAVLDLEESCTRWLYTNMLFEEPPPEFTVGTLVLVGVADGDVARHVLTRTTGPAIVNDEGERVVALEGIEGHHLARNCIVVDDVRAFIGAYGTGEPVSAGELGETGCDGCTRLSGALCVLQEAHRRFVHHNWLANYPPPARPPGPPLYGPGSPDDRKQEPEDPDAN